MDESKSTYNFKGPKRRLEDDVILDLKEIVNSTRNWVVSGEDRDYWRVLLNELHKPWI